MIFTKESIRKALYRVARIFFTLIGVAALIAVIFGVYMMGFVHGYKLGQEESQQQLSSIIEGFINKVSKVSPTPLVTKVPTPVPPKKVSPISWGGPELWDAVNKKRTEYGVNQLNSRGELCTIASIRLNELMDLGKLDNHEGFTNMSERRPDLKWIFDKYAVVAEFLALGGQSPQETVTLWDNTLGHKKLLTGGEYIWGCIYAQNTFAVAIAAY